MTAATSSAGADSLARLVHEASELRDYLLRVEGVDGTNLDRALRPFEKIAKPSDAQEDQINTLTTSFQDAFDAAFKTIDRYTLSEVLKGRSPFKTKNSFLGNFGLTLVGIGLVIAALYYTNWSNRTSQLIEEAKRFSEFRYHETINKLIELEGLLSGDVKTTDTSIKEVHLFYQETEQALKSHYLDEWDIPEQLQKRSREVSPIVIFWDNLHRRTCPDNSTEDVSYTLFQKLILCPLPFQSSGGPTLSTNAAVDAIKDVQVASAEEPEEIDNLSVFHAKHDKIMEEADRQIGLDYQQSRRWIFTTSERLKGSLSNIHTWALPIIYGMLGSVIYCMWRVLNPNLAAVGFTYTIIRTAFAGLAALTLSMLLIPSNVLSIGIDLHRPFIYLLSFIFGYSVEAFVSTLSLINTYFSSNLTPRRQAEGK